MHDQPRINAASGTTFGKLGKFYQEQVEQLLAYAKNELELNKVVKEAINECPAETLRDQLEAVWKQTGKIPEQLSMELPVLFFDVWLWFIELNNARGNNGFGVNPISYSEIKAWAELTDNHPTSEDVRLIKMLDKIATNG